MKRKKMSARRLLAWVMIMVLLAACMLAVEPVQVSAEKASGYFKYVVLDDGTAMITGITDRAVASIQSTGKITIPDVIDGYSVTQLGAQSMSWTNIQKYLDTVIISEGITTIGTKAFYSLTSLSFVSLPSTLRVMNDQCFSATALVSVTLPAGVEKYGTGVFALCKSLKTVIVSEGAESLGASMFYKCTSLENVQLPSGLKEFRDYAFAGCSALEEIDIPSSVAVFGPGGFFQTKWLDKKRQERRDHLVIVNDIVIDGYLCTGDVVVPEGVKAVAAAAFAYGIKDECPGAAVASVWLPASVKSIGRGAFYDCTNLTKITLSDSLESVGAGAIPEGQGLMLVIPEGLTDISNLGLEKLSGVVFCVVEGGNVADFLLQNNITNYTTYAATEPKPQKPPAHNAEGQNSQEDRQDIYEKGKVYTVAKKRYRITSRNTVAFVGCANASVRKLTVPAGIRLGSGTYRVTAIAAGACKGNGKLQKVVIGKNVKIVGASAFRNCKKLTRLTYGAGVVEIQKNGLRGDVSLKKVTIKSRKLKRIGKAVFRQVPSSLTVKVPKNKLKKYKKMIRAAR